MMIRKTIRIIIHPIFIFLVISILECIPYYSNAKKVVLNEMPKKGDNFSVINEEAVYYYNGKGKFAYTSIDCFISCGNPPYDLSYKKGGIKTIKKSIANGIPYLGNMCTEKAENTIKNTPNSPLRYYLSTNYLLFNFSNISHILSYALLGCSTIFNVNNKKLRYGYGFLACFFGGAFLEVIQHLFVVGRNASVEDQLLNCLGATIGLLLFWILDRLKFIEKFRNFL